MSFWFPAVNFNKLCALTNQAPDLIYKRTFSRGYATDSVVAAGSGCVVANHFASIAEDHF